MAVAVQIRPWTLDDLERMPEDGNKYEVLDGDLFVTPAPSEQHEDVLARLTRILGPYVERHALGRIYHPRAVIRTQGSEVEPDLMVRAIRTDQPAKSWDNAPIPILVVEVLSPTTRNRDVKQKRDFYRRIGVADYWVIDADREQVLVVQPDREDVSASEALTWQPAAASEPLHIPLAAILRD